MDKVQKHNLFNTNMPSPESYKNDLYTSLCEFSVPHHTSNAAINLHTLTKNVKYTYIFYIIHLQLRCVNHSAHEF
jgi:hypothetical protein